MTPTFYWLLELQEPQAYRLLLSVDPVFMLMGWTNTIFCGHHESKKVESLRSTGTTR